MAVGALLALVALWGTHRVLTRDVQEPIEREPAKVATPAPKPAAPVQSVTQPVVEPPVVRSPEKTAAPREPTRRNPPKRPQTKRDDLEF